MTPGGPDTRRRSSRWARWFVTRSVRLARGALRAFPRQFRNAHGADMLALYRAHAAEAQRRGAVPVLRHALGALTDLVVAGLEERFRSPRGRRRRATKTRSLPGGVSRELGAARRRGRRPSGRRHLIREIGLACRHAVVALIRERGFVALTVVPVALGIAATTTIFSVADGVFLSPLPYPEPERLYVVGSAWPEEPGDISGLSIPNYLDVRRQVGSFETFGVVMGSLGLDRRHDDGATERVRAVRVADDVFELLGARAIVGRLPMRGELTAAVLSHREWLESWGGDAEAVGDTVTLSGESFTVVGVLSPDFIPPEGVVYGSSNPAFWTLLDLEDPTWDDSRSFGGFYVLGRLAEGVSPEVAQAELDAAADVLSEQYPEDNTRDGDARMLRLRDLHAYTVGESRGRVALLLTAVGLVLSISCINVAGLFVARGHVRAEDLAVRAALGAGRARLGALVIAEGSLIAGIGGIGGALLSSIGVDAFVALSPGDIPRLVEIDLDLRALAFAIGASTLIAMVATAVPALQAMGRRPVDVLRRSGATASPAPRRWRNALMALETGLVVVLLSAAVLFMRGFIGLAGVDRGIDAEGVLRVEVSTTEREPERYTTWFRNVAENLREVPGVTSVSGASLSLIEPMEGLWEVGVPPTAPEEPAAASVVLPDFFETLGIPIIAGSGFSWSADPAGPAQVVVSERLARELFGTADVVGRELALSDDDFARATIAGVAADTMRRTADGRYEPARALYIPYLQRPWLGRMLFAVRHEGLPSGAVAPVREAVRRSGGAVTLVAIDTLPEVISRTLVEPRFYSWLLTAFSLIALVIAAVGIYAVLAAWVAGRRREIGIRVALGASPPRVLAIVMSQALLIVAGGLALGLPVAFYTTRRFDGLIAGIESGGLAPHLVSAAILCLLAVSAAWAPARRALRVEPARVLSGDGRG